MQSTTTNRINGHPQTPPHNLFAERATVGCILLDNSKVPAVRAIVDGDDFHNPACASVFTVASDLVLAGSQADPVTVAQELESKGWLEQIGGPPVIHELLEAVPYSDHAVDYATIVAEKSRRRRIIEGGKQLIKAANDPTVDIETIEEMAARGSGGDGNATGLAPISFGELAKENPKLARPVIDGLLRIGEVANVISAAKVGKSWLSYNLALCVIHARLWLDTFQCVGGRVLLLDNELHKATLADRIPKVAKAMGIELHEYRDLFDVISLRGRQVDLYGLRPIIERSAGKYDLIILDAFYRFIPPGISESDNAGVASLYNTVDQYASTSGAAIALVHHSSKGNQSDKRVTDVGSGAGAQSRAADSHLIIREHEEPGLAVLDGAVRSFAPVDPVVLRWNFPLWRADIYADASQLKGRKSKSEERQAERDQSGMDEIQNCLKKDGPTTAREVRRRTGISRDRCERLIDKLEAAGELDFETIRLGGKDCRKFRLSGVVDE